MGLIKTAIMTGGGIYAVNKLAKAAEMHHNSQSRYPSYPPNSNQQDSWGAPTSQHRYPNRELQDGQHQSLYQPEKYDHTKAAPPQGYAPQIPSYEQHRGYAPPSYSPQPRESQSYDQPYGYTSQSPKKAMEFAMNLAQGISRRKD